VVQRATKGGNENARLRRPTIGDNRTHVLSVGLNPPAAWTPIFRRSYPLRLTATARGRSVSVSCDRCRKPRTTRSAARRPSRWKPCSGLSMEEPVVTQKPSFEPAPVHARRRDAAVKRRLDDGRYRPIRSTAITRLSITRRPADVAAVRRRREQSPGKTGSFSPASCRIAGGKRP
jgi:hypothetical protein